MAAYAGMVGSEEIMYSIEKYITGTAFFDPMIDGKYTVEEILISYGQEVSFNPDPELLEDMTISGQHFPNFDEALLSSLNQEHGLALSDDQMQYFYTLFTGEKYKRTPTLSELYLYAQLNSEHCRHNVFNGRIIVDGEVYEKSMFRHIRDTHKAHPGDVIVAYSDNGAIVK